MDSMIKWTSMGMIMCLRGTHLLSMHKLIQMVSYSESSSGMYRKCLVRIFGAAIYSGTSDNGLPLLQKPPQYGQEPAVPNHSLLFTVYCDLCIAETSLLWITDTVVTPQRTKPVQISLWKRTVLTYWYKRVEKYLLFLKILAVSIHSTTFQGLSVIKERSTFNHVAYATGNGRHNTGCALRKEDTSLLRTLLCGPACLYFRGSTVYTT